MANFLNHYTCPRCAEEWSDAWDCLVDDDCPACGLRHISPTSSDDLDEEASARAALFLTDWRNPAGHVVGTEVREGETPARSHVCADLPFSDPLYGSRLAAWRARAAAQDKAVRDLRGPAWAADLPAGRWRDGRAFAAAVQMPLTPVDAHVLASDWGGTARPMTEAEQAAVLPAHVETVALHDGPEDQHLVPGVAPVPLTTRPLAQERTRRASRRGAAPLPSGGLFDDAARAQQDLFA